MAPKKHGRPSEMAPKKLSEFQGRFDNECLNDEQPSDYEVEGQQQIKKPTNRIRHVLR